MFGKTINRAEYCMFRSRALAAPGPVVSRENAIVGIRKRDGRGRRAFLSRLVAGVAMALTVAQGIAGGTAEQVGPTEIRQIRSVIEGQLKALAANDASLAFSYASASIRMQFGDAHSFMTMVRQGYPMLIRPSETLFPPPHVVGDGVIQTVHLRDQDGRAWRARYHMLQQPDGSWQINGCVVDPDWDDTST